MLTRWYVTYRNEDRPERSPQYCTEKAARNEAKFLKWQGATSVRVRRTNG